MQKAYLRLELANEHHPKNPKSIGKKLLIWRIQKKQRPFEGWSWRRNAKERRRELRLMGWRGGDEENAEVGVAQR